MKIIKDIDNFNFNNSVVTVGTFDGLHLGHKKILKSLKAVANKFNTTSIVFTFWPHPRFVLGKSNDLELLNTFEEKVNLFKNNGIDILICYEFTNDFAKLSAYEFVKNILVKKLKIRYLVLGYDHHFGKNREGRFEKLKQCADEFNFKIEQVLALSVNNENISSTKIRNYIKLGDLEKANHYLGYNYFIQGKIIEGNKIGRKIGFPTANISIPLYKLLPRQGVYAVQVVMDGKKFIGMLNIGRKPTLGNENIKTIEVHIINFNNEIYGKIIKIDFIKRIREERKFKNINKLKEQLIKDKEFVIGLLDKL